MYRDGYWTNVNFKNSIYPILRWNIYTKQRDSSNMTSEYVEKRIGELKAGDEFIWQNKNYRVVDKEDYKKVFGQFFLMVDNNNILALCKNENRFTCFSYDTIIRVKRELKKLSSLTPGSDFEYMGKRYYLYRFEIVHLYNRRVECIKLDDRMKSGRILYVDVDTMVYPLT